MSATSDQDTMATLLRYHAWANQNVSEICLNLGQERLSHSHPGARVLATRGEGRKVPTKALLMQAIYHAREHRGQAVILVGQQGWQSPLVNGWN